MINSHTPRLRFALFAALLGTALNILAISVPDDRMIWSMITVGVFSYVLAVVEVVLVVVAAHNERIVVETSRIREIAQCPADRLNALGYVMPELGLHIINSLPIPMWEGAVELGIFRKFLVASRDDYVAPIREWGKSEEDIAAYDLILNKLMELGYVYSRAEGGEPRGPKSWLFRPNALKLLWAQWMGWEVIFEGIKEL